MIGSNSDLLIDADSIKSSVHNVHPTVSGRQYEQRHQSLHNVQTIPISTKIHFIENLQQ